MRLFWVLGLASCSVIGCKITTGEPGDKNLGGANSGAGAGTTGDADGAGGSAHGGSSGTSHAGAANTGDASGAAGVDGSNQGEAGAGSGSFVPSNIPSSAALSGNGDLAITDSNCTADGLAGKITCSGSEISGYGYELVNQTDPDHSKLAVFSARNFTVESSAKLSLTGPYPVAIVAKGTVRINGTVVATVDGIYFDRANAGGFAGISGPGPGNGPGAGDAPDQATKAGAGGGAYCGAGGPGGGMSGPASNGGKPYGEKTLHPLLGGSSGGASDFGKSGGGGGAIHLFAGSAVEIGVTGVVGALGGGGDAIVTGAGSSAGAILIEAPKVRIAGIVTASGGGGGAHHGNGLGQNGRLDGKPAKGGVGDMNSDGGDGSAGTAIDGSPGVFGTGDTMGGSGGGGAGWIRINSASGDAEITGTISPSLTTKCASQGMLAP
jgi:hypothetical protein